MFNKYHLFSGFGGALQTFGAIGSFSGVLLMVFIIRIKNIKLLSVCLSFSLAFLNRTAWIFQHDCRIILLGLGGLASGILNVYLETHLQTQTLPIQYLFIVVVCPIPVIAFFIYKSFSVGNNTNAENEQIISKL